MFNIFKYKRKCKHRSVDRCQEYIKDSKTCTYLIICKKCCKLLATGWTKEDCEEKYKRNKGLEKFNKLKIKKNDMRNKYPGVCKACGDYVGVKAGRWRLTPKQTQDFTGLRCKPCSTTTKKNRRKILDRKGLII